MKFLTIKSIVVCLLGFNSTITVGQNLTEKIESNEYFDFTKNKALEIVKTGFNAGDGYGDIPKEKAKQSDVGYEYIFTDLESNYAGHKNTVETDHETSLVQAVYKYVKKTGNTMNGTRLTINPKARELFVVRPECFIKLF